MKTFLKQNLALVLAFALPVVLIVAVALGRYLPSLFVSTSYNFIYTACADTTNYYYYNCEQYLQQRYLVENGKLVTRTVNLKQDNNKDGQPDFNETYDGRIFLHDTKKNESREITLEEAKLLTLNNLLTSPDGITVSSHYDSNRSDFIFFGGGSSSFGYYLTKGNSRSKLHLINNDDRYYYQNNFQFIGWVLPGRTE